MPPLRAFQMQRRGYGEGDEQDVTDYLLCVSQLPPGQNFLMGTS